MSAAGCPRRHEALGAHLDGVLTTSLREHVAGCDDCRDARHDLEELAQRMARAGDDAEVDEALGDRLAAIADAAASSSSPSSARRPERISETRVREGMTSAPSGRPRSKKSLWLLLAACASIGVSVVAGLKLADRHETAAVGTRTWHGKIAKIARSGADHQGTGVSAIGPAGKVDLAEGAELRAGAKIATDGRTRARLDFDDGTVVILDRATTVTVDGAPRTLALEEGALLADVAHVGEGKEANSPVARITSPTGEVRILGTKLSVTAASGRTNVEVLRGEVEVAASGGKPQKVYAGQEGVLSSDGRLDVAPANDMASRAAFGEQLVALHNEDAEAPASGLGELRARRPGKTDEKDHAVRLAKHAVKVRIAGNVARTEIDETFTNDTSDELEGIYRFPLPPGAQIERLALEVDGKLVDGEFVDRQKAAAIWRGAIQNAAPKAPKPKEEIVWVPGPWHDPALLEWARGGRFELKIFPIPKKGSRRVVIAYTETVAPVSGVRRYVYPLPQGSSSKLAIDEFSVDAQVLGHDAKSGVRVRGYELEHKTDGAAERLSSAISSFTPSGDLAIEYALDDRASDATAWAYRAPDAGSQPSNGKANDPIGTDAFVAIALRPKLPKWTDPKSRDQVIVVDTGRAMYGERFARAKRLAVQMTQEMDRRDRVTVLACDVTCRALPGGFVAPGATGAHDVDAFLAGLTPDGASDLVSAVRSASSVAGHDSARNLRITVVSDGVATAGYREGARVAAETADACASSGAEVVAVPLGADADVALLGELARGGGGVVVPYQPGQRLESTALEVLNATYGTTLRDVELVLPEGLHEVAPQALAPMRAGGETIVTARLSGEFAKGDIVLRGKVGGDSFEAKYPIDVSAKTDVGNAFVPRLYAAARIADRDRSAQDSSRTELVALSRRFAVPSRYTSLLVLESEAMFKAFGIERSEHAAAWTGEVESQGVAAGPGTGTGFGSGHARLDLNPFDDDAFGSEAKKDKESEGGGLGLLGRGAGGGGRPSKPAAEDSRSARGDFKGDPLASTMPAPAPTMVPPPTAKFGDFAERRPPPRPGGEFMKRVWVRHATIVADATSPVSADKIAQARAAVAAAPDERSKHKELTKMLALGGQLDELGEVLEKWSSRDPLDVDVIVGRADLAARRGDRDGALRILGGALAASSLSRDEAFVLASTVARGYDRLGRPDGCAFKVTAAELRPSDNDAVARAVSCERAQGRGTSADRWLAGLKDLQRTAVSSALAKTDAAKAESTNGDVVVVATWEGGADLDVALIDPSGRRASVVTRMKGARVEGGQSSDHETLALTSGDAGSFVVEVVRGSSLANAAVRGKVAIRAFGQTQTVPFTLTASRVQVARVDVRWEQELVRLDNDDLTPTLPSVLRSIVGPLRCPSRTSTSRRARRSARREQGARASRTTRMVPSAELPSTADRSTPTRPQHSAFGERSSARVCRRFPAVQ
ncbi:hypothetical protein AKJ09_08571 [Labilithrix luteola]|uniref:VIT domain-containing protein n=1 Tax=Labilithrix luteola TaxID=1391654 RepID=A0A0K1Q842_9BACT|nr:VIT domain-containing protein [Labilithrix luteola]AKV01908.1 hypothetical protein AKJ09_08571 [Labilithrix luteola]